MYCATDGSFCPGRNVVPFPRVAVPLARLYRLESVLVFDCKKALALCVYEMTFYLPF